MVDFRRTVLALLTAVAATAAFAQEQPGRPAGERSHAEQARRSRTRRACSRCCPGTRSPSTASIRRPGSLLIRRPPARSRCSTRSASVSAAVFYTAYVAEGRNDPAAAADLRVQRRAGRGLRLSSISASSVRASPISARTAATAPTSALVDNPDTWLAFTDLVMIDPVGTGWSRAAKPDDANSFWGVRRDAESLAKVIALYVAKNSRGSSPKYHARRKLRRLPRRQGRRRSAERPGHRRHRHRHGVAAARRRVPVRRRPRSRSAPRCNCRRWSPTELERNGQVQHGGAGARPSTSR